MEIKRQINAFANRFVNLGDTLNHFTNFSQ
jgi:hypothetical protein